MHRWPTVGVEGPFVGRVCGLHAEGGALLGRVPHSAMQDTMTHYSYEQTVRLECLCDSCVTNGEVTDCAAHLGVRVFGSDAGAAR